MRFSWNADDEANPVRDHIETDGGCGRFATSLSSLYSSMQMHRMFGTKTTM